MSTISDGQGAANGAHRVRWAALDYNAWSRTCDTLHAHTQLLGKLSLTLAPPEPQLQHAALRLTARGWETATLPAPDGSGSLVITIDLRFHETIVEHSDGRVRRIALGPDRSVREVTHDVVSAVTGFVGPVRLNFAPQEVPWNTPLDLDDEHCTYDPTQASTYFQAATRAALCLAELRAPYRGRSSPVNAWWGSFDLAVALYSGRAADPPSHDFIVRNSSNAQHIEVGWWPGDARYPKAAFFAFSYPPLDGASTAQIPSPARWDDAMGEYLIDWNDVVSSTDPRATVLDFGRAVIAHACSFGDWDAELSSSAQGARPAVT